MDRVVFIGSKNTGYHCLRHLLHRKDRGDTFQLVGVLARHDDLNLPDDAWWRSVAQLGEDHDIPVLTPEKVNTEHVRDELAALDPTVGFCVFYPQILQPQILDMFPRGIVNLHFAPLPRYRGVMPIPHAILNGEDEHGVTMHLMTPGIDDGPIVAQTRVPIHDDDTGLELYQRCEVAGVELFRRTFPRVLDGEVTPTPQDEDAATYHSKGELSGREVDLDTWSEERVDRYVRALEFPPYPLPYIRVNDRRIHLRTEPGLTYTQDHLAPFLEDPA